MKLRFIFIRVFINKNLMIDLRKKKILITGADGFVGRHLVKNLLEKRNVPRENLFLPSFKELDLRKWEDCQMAVRGQDIVIHLAAKVGGIGLNREKPGELFYDNIVMGAQLMEAARQAKVEKFVAIGTICSYPKFTPIPFKEENLWQGYPEETNAPYGLAKKMLLVQGRAYSQQYGFNEINLLPVNMYGPCFSGDTEVMTREGIKNIKELKTGEVVYTLNPKSFEVEESNIIATQQIPTKEMFIFKGRSVNFRVTPDHKIFYRTSTGFVKRSADYFRTRAGKKYGQITFAFHKPKKEGEFPKFIDLQKYVDEGHIKIGDECVKDFGGSRGNSSRAFPIRYQSKDFARFIGWYVAEGSTAQTGKNSTQIRITQWPNNENYRHEIDNLLKLMRIPFGKDDNGFYFTSRIWAKFIKENIGEGVENKKLPKFIFDWHPKLLKLVFESMMKGDGNKSGGRYTSKSHQLMLDFFHTAFLCGVKVGSVTKDNDGCWRISLRDCRKHTTVKYKDIRVEKIDEIAYCITTDKNHIIYAGSNLKFNWIGQCDNYDPKSSHVIAALIRKIDEAKKEGKDYVEVWGTGKPTREFMYVEDGAEGIILAAEKYDKPEPVNLGSGAEISIKDLAQLICKLMGFKGEIRWDKSKPDGQPRRCLDVSRAEKEFGFKALTLFEDGLKKTIDSYDKS
jgi:nucleoside-diphosphate-sugar epimerase